MLKISVSDPGGTEDAALPRATATIIAFPSPKPRTPRFSVSDRAILESYGRDGSLPAGLGVVMTDDCEFGEYASFTRVENSWSEWNVAPEDGLLALWNSRNGADLGKFDGMYCVFAALDRVSSGDPLQAMKANSGHVPCPQRDGGVSMGCSCAVQCARLKMAS